MFTYLKVQNFALIDDVEIDFRRGFTAFVGETGAGKSLLVDAIDLLSGARSSANFVKKGTEMASIQGSFYLPTTHPVFQILAEDDINVEPGEELLVQRQIMVDGRSICRIQGVKITANTLRAVVGLLIDIHGQHESSSLLNNKNHLSLLDTFAQNDRELGAYHQEYDTYQKLLQEQKKLQQLADEIEKIAHYEKQISELEKEHITQHEIKEIDERLQTLRTFNRNFDTLVSIKKLFSESNLVTNLYQIQHAFRTIQQTSQETSDDYVKRVESAYYDLQDIEMTISEQVNSFLEQKEEQEQLERRIATIFSLQKKYGDDLEAALETLQEKVAMLQNLEFDALQLEKQVTAQYDMLVKAAEVLHKNRQAAATEIAREIMQQLKDLHMDKVEFAVHFEQKKLSRTGSDAVEFYIKTNVGSDFGPLSKISSGGELSRIMLAIKIVFARNQALSTIIFDEIDTGVSGKVAVAIAKKMRIFSEAQQVFAITHLPQVLAASQHQLFIEKTVSDEATHIQVRYLQNEEHQREVAKMLSGSELTAVGLEHAQNLITSFE